MYNLPADSKGKSMSSIIGCRKVFIGGFSSENHNPSRMMLFGLFLLKISMQLYAHC